MHRAPSCPGTGLPCEQASPLQQQPGLLQRLFEMGGTASAGGAANFRGKG